MLIVCQFRSWFLDNGITDFGTVYSFSFPSASFLLCELLNIFTVQATVVVNYTNAKVCIVCVYVDVTKCKEADFKCCGSARWGKYKHVKMVLVILTLTSKIGSRFQIFNWPYQRRIKVFSVLRTRPRQLYSFNRRWHFQLEIWGKWPKYRATCRHYSLASGELGSYVKWQSLEVIPRLLPTYYITLRCHSRSASVAAEV